MSKGRFVVRYLHIAGVIAKAQFATEGGLLYRYRLEITKTAAPESPRTVCAVMQNPSYASEDVADKSVQFLEKNVFERQLPEFKNAQRLIVVNQFARVQTIAFVGLPSDIGACNDSAIVAALKESEIIVVAWGSSNRFEQRKQFVIAQIARMPGKQLYKTAMHPSRGRYLGFIQPYAT
jgi:hypothetical protein